MKKRFILPLIGMLAFSLTSCGTNGDTGPQGPQGEQGVPGQNGQDGKDGTNGVDGKDGTSVLTGNGEPAASLSKDGDSYIDLDTWNYYVKENGTWVLKGNIKGSDGIDGQNGQDGQDGQDGTSMLSGSGEPASNLGKDGDSYIDIATWNYYVKENGSWALKGNIKGSDGKDGQDGIDGNDGQDAVQYIPAIFNNYDGTMLYTFYYEKGSTIVYDGPEPTRNGYVQDGDHYVYDFIGWDKPLENIQVPTIFTAQYNLRNATEEYNISIGKIPNLSEDGKTITYGLYPTNNINNNEELVAALDELAESGSPEANGYYLYNDKYYAKTVADAFTYASKSFANGIEFTNGETYWFECEPITWNVLDNHNGEYILLSSIVLDQCYYYSPTNNNKYKDSYIRSWINGDFYDSAFVLDNSYIQTTTIDNSASTTASETNPYACENTEDKVFLLSYQDYLNNDYGFPSSNSWCGERVCPTTDWAKARGISIYSYETSGRYWTRSPNEETYVCAMYVNKEGSIFEDNTDRKYGVRPAITIKIA